MRSIGQISGPQSVPFHPVPSQRFTMPDPRIPSDARWEDLTIPMPELVQFALRWTLLLAIFLFLPFFIFWGFPEWPSLAELPLQALRFILYIILFLVIYAVSAVIHEVLHAVAMVVLAKIPWKSIHFVARLREGIAYVHAHQPMTASAYRGILVLPGIVLGIIPALAGLLAGSGWLVFYGFVMLSSAIGDFAMLRLMRPLDSDTLVRDHPEKVGCQVLRDYAVNSDSGEG